VPELLQLVARALSQAPVLGQRHALGQPLQALVPLVHLHGIMCRFIVMLVDLLPLDDLQALAPIND